MKRLDGIYRSKLYEITAYEIHQRVMKQKEKIRQGQENYWDRKRLELIRRGFPYYNEK